MLSPRTRDFLIALNLLDGVEICEVAFFQDLVAQAFQPVRAQAKACNYIF
jgi:hypothetical protein